MDGFFSHSKTEWRTAATRFIHAWLGLVALTADIHAAEMTARFDRNTTYLNESVTLSVEFENVRPTSSPIISWPSGLRVANAGNSQQFRSVNGRTTHTFIYKYLVTPLKEGEFTIRSIRAKSGNRSLSAGPLKLKVLPANRRPKDDPMSNYAFLKLVLEKKQVYVGEVFPLEVRLYHATDVDDIQYPKLDGEGFTMGSFIKPEKHLTQIGNTRYGVYTFKRAATAIKASKLALGPATTDLKLLQQIPGDFFRRNRRIPVSLKSDVTNLEVLPLPSAGRPADFSGAVGQFAMVASAAPLEVKAGDPITVKVTLSGSGPIESLGFPKLNWPGFKSYDPSAETRTTGPLGLSGSKVFEQVVIPEVNSITELPELRFSFFDPQRRQYRTLTKTALPLKVTPAEKSDAPPATLSEVEPDENEPQDRVDIVNIKVRLGSISHLAPPLFLRPWFWGLQAIPFALWAAAVIIRKRRDALANNPRIARRRRVDREVRDGLEHLKTLAESGQMEPFFAGVSRLLQEQIGERLDQPAGGITAGALEDLARLGTADETLEQLRELFAACDQARYALQQSPGQLTAIVIQLEETLATLRQMEVPH